MKDSTILLFTMVRSNVLVAWQRNRRCSPVLSATRWFNSSPTSLRDAGLTGFSGHSFTITHGVGEYAKVVCPLRVFCRAVGVGRASGGSSSLTVVF